MSEPEFLDLEGVLEIHALQLAAFGGLEGVRDQGLLESALEQPRATAFGELLHSEPGPTARHCVGHRIDRQRQSRAGLVVFRRLRVTLGASRRRLRQHTLDGFE